MIILMLLKLDPQDITNGSLDQAAITGKTWPFM
jgi:hypothetical protein